MPEPDDRALLHQSGPDGTALHLLCADALAVLDPQRRQGGLTYDLVEVVVDCGRRLVTLRNVLDAGLPEVRLPAERFEEVAAPLAALVPEAERQAPLRRWARGSGAF
jgi:hypothetical protein